MTNSQNNTGDVELVAMKLMRWRKHIANTIHWCEGDEWKVRGDYKWVTTDDWNPSIDENHFQMCMGELVKYKELFSDYQDKFWHAGADWALEMYMKAPLSERWEALVSTVREHA